MRYAKDSTKTRTDHGPVACRRFYRRSACASEIAFDPVGKDKKAVDSKAFSGDIDSTFGGKRTFSQALS